MKIYQITTLILTGMMAAVTAHAQTTDFSGTWKVNKTRSDAGELSINSIPIQLIIKQDKSLLMVERTATNAAAEIKKETENLKLDGSPVKRAADAGLTKTTTLKWSPDGKSLTETVTYSDSKGEVTRTIHKLWAMDGNLLHIVLDSKDQQESYRLDEYFDKQ